MIDFPIADLFDDSLCLVWLERHLHPAGLSAPRAQALVAAGFARRATTTPIAVVSATATIRSSAAQPLKAVVSGQPHWCSCFVVSPRANRRRDWRANSICRARPSIRCGNGSKPI